MKLFVLSICAAFFGVAGFAAAQQAADADLAAKPTESIEAKPTPAPTAPSVPDLAQLDQAFKQTSMGKAGDELRLRVEWRKLRNQVVNDPAVVAARHGAEAARTDLDKRDGLRAYYKLYYARIRRLPMSAEMKQRLAAMEAINLGGTAQPRVRPSPSALPAASR